MYLMSMSCRHAREVNVECRKVQVAFVVQVSEHNNLLRAQLYASAPAGGECYQEHDYSQHMCKCVELLHGCMHLKCKRQEEILTGHNVLIFA